MFRSLQSRLWLSYLLLISVLITVALMSLLVYLLRNPAQLRQANAQIVLASRLLQRAGLEWSPALVKNLVKRTDELYDTRLLVLDADNREVLADSRQDSAASFNINALRSVVVTKTGEQPRRMRDSTGQVWLYMAHSLPGNRLLVITLPRPRITLLGLLREEPLRPFFLAAVAALLLALVSGSYIAGWTLSPLRRMAQAARGIADGRFEPIPVEGPAEVQQVAQAFNEMTTRVQTSQQAQRDFVANVSHDLKTPLTSIQGFAQAILDGTAETPEARKQAAQVIYEEAGRMHRMVQELLELARLDSGIASLQHVPLELGALLQGAAKRLQPQAQQAQLQLQVEIQPLPGMVGDPDRLTQVFSNLLDNALKFTPPGGVVQLSARPEGGQVVVLVCDSGPGIPEGDLPRIFDRFYQVDKSRSGGRGAGLGLAIARQIIQAHGGVISAYNNAGAGQPPQGSTFMVKLPVAASPDARSDASTIVSRKG